MDKLDIKFRPLGKSILEKQQIYSTVSLLVKKGYVKSRRFTDHKSVFYELTESGELIALLISKEIDTEEQYRNLIRGNVRWFLD